MEVVVALGLIAVVVAARLHSQKVEVGIEDKKGKHLG